jgi:hypothetical protein
MKSSSSRPARRDGQPAFFTTESSREISRRRSLELPPLKIIAFLSDDDDEATRIQPLTLWPARRILEDL